MDQAKTTETYTDTTDRILPWLILLFVGSGCAALIYEIVWLQLLQLIVGSTALSMGVLLGTFMGGMCFGSLLLPRIIPARWHPLRVYAVLELGIGAMGIGILLAIPYIDSFYIYMAHLGWPSVLVRGSVGIICLLPPTLLMGATLPAIARWIETTPRGIGWLGFFYGGNIAGAVFGCLLAGFYLLRVHDMAVATWVAASINLLVAVVAFVLAARAPYRVATPEPLPEAASGAPLRARGSAVVYLCIALSGFTALGSEVVWARLLALLLGATVYTFSIILAVFLVGLGIGSSVGSALARVSPRPRMLFAVCQMMLTVCVGWAGYASVGSLPHWPIDTTLSVDPWYMFQLDILRSIWVVLPGALFWGASFPLALAGVAVPGQDPGRLVGGVYAANTVGAIAGAMITSLVALGNLGTQMSQQLIIMIAAISALLLLLSHLQTANEEVHVQPSFVGRGLAIVVLAVMTVVALRAVPEIDPGLIAYGRNYPTRHTGWKELHVEEGANASIAITRLTNSTVRNFHVSGKVVASSEPQDMRLQRMLGHLSALLHEEPKSVLIVGCGAGVTAGTFVLYPSIERIVICEIEPTIPPAAQEYFGYENHYVMDDPRVEVIYDDARHFILTTDEKFDIITSDPIHPWVKGAAALYSRDYYELCLKKLNPGGVITQWVPLYESSLDAVKSEIRTFFEAFPDGCIWSNDYYGEGYDVVMYARHGGGAIDVDAIQAHLDSTDYTPVVQSMSEVGFPTAVDLLGTYAGTYNDLSDWLADAQINTDRNLRLQYLAGMGVNRQESIDIFNDILTHLTFPEGFFVVNRDAEQYLRRVIQRLY